MMSDVNLRHILAVAHSVLCLVVWQSCAHSANYSNATGRSLPSVPELLYSILWLFCLLYHTVCGVVELVA